MTGVNSVRSDIFVSGGNQQGGRCFILTRTHFFVHQPERNRLITDESLVVTLGIRNALLKVPAVREGVNNVTYLPLVVLLVFQ